MYLSGRAKPKCGLLKNNAPQKTVASPTEEGKPLVTKVNLPLLLQIPCTFNTYCFFLLKYVPYDIRSHILVPYQYLPRTHHIPESDFHAESHLSYAKTLVTLARANVYVVEVIGVKPKCSHWSIIWWSLPQCPTEPPPDC